MSIQSDIKYPTAAELKAQFIEDLELQAIDAEIDPPPVAPGSDWDLLATSSSNRMSQVVAAVQTLDNDSNPLVAAGAPLDELLKRNGLPEVLPAPGSGQVQASISGTATVQAGTKIQASGMKGTVARTLLNATGAPAVDIVMDATGPLTNLPVGSKVRFMNQPANVATEATVIATFTGGTGVESEDRKRTRLLTALNNPPGGGNWSQMVLEAYAASGSIGGAFCYPAIGGPSSNKLVLTSNTTTITREVSDSVIALVQARLLEKFPAELWANVVQSAINQSVDVALSVRLPVSGSGVWRANGPVTPLAVTYVGSATSFVAQPVTGTGAGIRVGDTIASWSDTAHAFSTATVVQVIVVGSTYTIATQLWSGEPPVVGSWISPACEGIDDIATAWLAEMLKLGPGENVSSSDARFSRAFRHPDVTEGAPMELTSRQAGALQAAVTDVIRAEYLLTLTSAAPVTPATVADKPSVLCLRKFGIYPL